jgi:hypothetical protein
MSNNKISVDCHHIIWISSKFVAFLMDYCRNGQVFSEYTWKSPQFYNILLNLIPDLKSQSKLKINTDIEQCRNLIEKPWKNTKFIQIGNVFNRLLENVMDFEWTLLI